MRDSLFDFADVAGVIAVVRDKDCILDVIAYELDGTVAHRHMCATDMETEYLIIAVVIYKRDLIDTEKILPMRPASIVVR